MTEIGPHRPCPRYVAIRMARLAFIRVALFPRAIAERNGRVDRVHWTVAIGGWRFWISKVCMWHYLASARPKFCRSSAWGCGHSHELRRSMLSMNVIGWGELFRFNLSIHVGSSSELILFRYRYLWSKDKKAKPCPKDYIQGEIIYAPPPPSPHFWPEGIFQGRGGWGCIFWGPARQEFYTPPAFYTHQTPRRVFSGEGGWACIKFGPEDLQALVFLEDRNLLK